MSIHLLLGLQKAYRTDGEQLLAHILRCYSLSDVRYEYCYTTPPPSQQKIRRSALLEARSRLEAIWLSDVGPIIGFGWMACELLTNRGRTRLSNTVGTRWTYVGSITCDVWIANDPAGALFDPNLVVDISAVIVAAAQYANIPVQINPHEAQFHWSKYI